MLSPGDKLRKLLGAVNELERCIKGEGRDKSSHNRVLRMHQEEWPEFWRAVNYLRSVAEEARKV